MKNVRGEDYHLWIRAIKKNIIIRNIPLPLVKSKLNNSFIKEDLTIKS